jgi:acyl phosphate:glycerol-3-phosphate acyltransferase
VRPDWLILPVAYLLGSIPFGLLIVRARAGRDIRGMGSGNIGAANVARSAGALAGVLTLLLDAAKGYLAVWIAGRWTGSNMRWMMAAAVAAVVGHIFSAWLGFRGGKGVATGLGVFLPICASAVGVAVVLWLIVVAFWRYSSLGSVVAAAALPIFVYLLYAPGHAPPGYVTVPTILISLLVLAKHRENIERLIAGSEPRLDSRR